MGLWFYGFTYILFRYGGSEAALNPRPTTRSVIEPSLVCNIKCKFCYHLHRYDSWKDTVKPQQVIQQEIDASIARGNDYTDITGGEPTIYPGIAETVAYALSRGMKSCIITNGIVVKKRADEIMDASLDDWLVSRHGLEETHDFVTNYPGAYRRQVRFLQNVRERMSVRFNCVINRYNQGEILEIAKEMAVFKPSIVSWINFNPHHGWQKDIEGTRNVIADLSVVQPLLEQAIDYLESRDIGVNVRYFPACALSERYRRTVCNDLHVMLDDKEWDYATTPKTVEKYRQWGVATSNANEEKGEPCCRCDLQWICGGANKHWHRAATDIFGEPLRPVLDFQGDKHDFYHYRQHNIMTLTR